MPIKFSLKFLSIFVLCLFSATVFLLDARGAEAADSADAFMSATFGLSSARTQKRMENSGAVAADFVRDGRLTMKGTFESRSTVFVFGFHAKKGLNHKAAYIASSGDAQVDRALYDALREAYNASFGKTDERVAENVRAKGRITLRSNWKPNQYTTIVLSCNPAITERFPGDSPGGRPIHLIYTYTKWTK
ncbi:MAG: hypothetical protein LBT65_10090 [Synergistaceae bacterium]|nr:hypothetical protein [Synergistaceae bacterium]